MKKLVLLIGILLMTFILISCDKPENNDDTITITYASWNLGNPDSTDPNMERLMIQKFMDKYPNIKVEVIERPKIPGTTDDLGWGDFLKARASTQTLPDVFQADDIPYYVINDWAYNITEIAKADPEYMNISEDIRGVVDYSGKVMALPNAVHYAGYVVNKTLYERQGQDNPTVNSTMQEVLDLTKAAANHSSTNNTGVVGFEGIEHILHWYPAQLNPDFGWFTLSDTGFNLNSTEFAQTMQLYRQLQTDPTYVLEALQYEASKEDSGVVLADIFPEGDNFNNGNILCKFFYSWDFGWIQTKINNGEYTWNLDFIGTPVVNNVKRVPIVADFFTIASTTEHPQEAYLFAKWMGFGKDGYAKRIELSETVTGIPQVNFAPIQNDSDLLDAYFELYPSFLGLRTIIENGTFIVEPPKYLPGYINARYQGTYDAENKMGDIINKLRYGEVQLADISTELNNRANALYNEARQAFDAALAQR